MLLLLFLLSTFLSFSQITLNAEFTFPGSTDFPPLRPKAFCTEIKGEITVTNTTATPLTISVSITSNNQEATDPGLFQENSSGSVLTLDLTSYMIEANSVNVFTVYTRINKNLPFDPPLNQDNIGYDVTAQVDGVPGSEVTDGQQFIAITSGAFINGTGVIPAKVSGLMNAELFPVTPGPFTNNTASNSHQFIRLAGILWVDVPEYWFTFSGGTFDPNGIKSEINMEEGAEIIVKSGSILNLGATVTSCGDQMWKSITVEDGATLNITHSLIEGGQFGILAHDGATVNVLHTTFQNNYVGIRTPKAINGTQNNINFTLYGNTFTSDGNLKAPYQGQVPTPGTLPFAGMELNNVPFVAINFTPVFKTTFSNLANGIVSINSTLTLGNVDFENIQALPNTTYPFSGRGISARSNSLLHTLTHSGNAFGNSTYDNCDIGVYAEGINTTLFDLTMNKVRVGIHLEKNNARVLRINDNTINATHTGIFLNDNSFNYVSEVKDNIIAVENLTNSGFGIRGADMINMTTDGYGWDIENNYIDISNNLFGTGILYDMGSFNNYIGNSIQTDLGNFDTHTGFELVGGGNNRVLCNSFTGNASATPSGLIAEGYYFNGTNNTDISCNEASNVDRGIKVFAMSDNILLRGNNIWDAGTGLQLGLDSTQGNTFIGEQSHHGNMWEPDADLTDNNFGAVHFGNNPFMITESAFDVDSTATPPIASRTYLPSNATPNVTNVPWFQDIPNNPTYSCTTANTCPDGIGYHGLVNDDDDNLTKLDELIATQNLSTDGYDASMSWVAKRHLFQKLKAIEFDTTTITTPSDQLMASFYNAESNTSIGEFHQIAESITDVFILDASTASSLTSQRNTFDGKIDSLENLDTEIHSGNLTESQLATKMAGKENLLSELISIDELGISFSEQVNNQKKLIIDDILDDNALISTTEVYETNEKEINQIYLNHQLNTENAYSPQDVMTIEGIANQCPLSGGDAVYKARAIMAALSPDQTYDDVILCLLNNETKRIGNEREKRLTKLQVQPNPTSDILEVLVTTTAQDLKTSQLTIAIYNSIGQKMLERDTKYESKEIFDVQGFEAGIYAIMIRSKKGDLLRSSKVIIISN